MGNEAIYLTVVTSVVAILGSLFTGLQFKLARKKRKDDLFNLRYEFYRNLSRIWIATNNRENPELGITDLIPIAEKANFLFGKEISKHVLSLEDKRASHDLFPDDDFSKPFERYLKL